MSLLSAGRNLRQVGDQLRVIGDERLKAAGEIVQGGRAIICKFYHVTLECG